jgi:hypothetical protein
MPAALGNPQGIGGALKVFRTHVALIELCRSAASRYWDVLATAVP